jgi:hypothetical protein
MEIRNNQPKKAKRKFQFDKTRMEREMQIVTLANAEVKRRGFDESHEEFGEMVEDLVYKIRYALFDYEKFLKVINWRKN